MAGAPNLPSVSFLIVNAWFLMNRSRARRVLAADWLMRPGAWLCDPAPLLASESPGKDPVPAALHGQVKQKLPGRSPLDGPTSHFHAGRAAGPPLQPGGEGRQHDTMYWTQSDSMWRLAGSQCQQCRKQTRQSLLQLPGDPTCRWRRAQRCRHGPHVAPATRGRRRRGRGL